MTDGSQRGRRRTRTVARMGWELAALGAALLHVAIFFLFSLEPAADVPYESVNESACVWVTPWEDAEIQEWERDLHAWCVLYDPTLLVLPQERLGFSRVRQVPRPLPVTPMPPHDASVTLAKEQSFSRFSLAGPFLTPEVDLSTRWVSATPLEAPPPSTAGLPRGLFWRYPDGTLIPDPPKVDLAELTAALSGSPAPELPTVLTIRGGEGVFHTRIRVTRSCGNPYLDSLAVSALRAEVSAVRIRRDFGGAKEMPAYLPAPGAVTVLEVEWSLLPAARSAE